jgi:small subunit ribosomal protein S20
MAITKSAKKALRQSKRRKVFNDRRTRAMRDAVKGARHGATQESVSAAYQAIDKALKRGTIKKNTAARKKSQLAKLLKAN